MKSSKEHLDKIEKALIAAHREQEDQQFPPGWRHGVMRDLEGRERAAAAQPEVKRAMRAPRRILSWAAAGLAVMAGFLILANLDWQDPWITLKPDLAAVNSHAGFWLAAGDQDSGLRHVKVTVVQKEMTIEVLSKDLEPPGGILGLQSDAVKQVDYPVVLDAKSLGLHQGKATVVVTVRDLSWRNGFKGRVTTLKKEMVIHYEKSP